MDKTKPREFTNVDDILSHLKPGDLIEFTSALIAKHWAVYIRYDNVADLHIIVHLSTDDDNRFQAVRSYLAQRISISTAPLASLGGRNLPKIIRSNLMSVAKGRKCRINNSDDVNYKALRVPDIIVRAMEQVGKTLEYRLFSNNCEHFARWCRYDRITSQQAAVFKSVVASAAVTASIGLNVANALVRSGPLAIPVAVLAGASQLVAKQAVKWYQRETKPETRQHTRQCSCPDCLHRKHPSMYFCGCAGEVCDCLSEAEEMARSRNKKRIKLEIIH